MLATPMLESTTDEKYAGPQNISSNSSEDSLFSDFNLLKVCKTASASRVGADFQVDELPEPGSYQPGGDEPSYETTWDPKRAEDNGLLDFVHLRCPPNKKEFAMSLLHELEYEDSGFWDALENICPLDDSDWTEDEKATFLRLMTETKHDILKIAQRLGKSVSNCLTVHYSNTGCNVRMTRSARRRLPLGSTTLSSEMDSRVGPAPISMKKKIRKTKRTEYPSQCKEVMEKVCDKIAKDSSAQNKRAIKTDIPGNTLVKKTENALDNESRDIPGKFITTEKQQEEHCPDIPIPDINVTPEKVASAKQLALDPTDTLDREELGYPSTPNLNASPEQAYKTNELTPDSTETLGETEFEAHSPYAEKNTSPTNDTSQRRMTRSASRRADRQIPTDEYNFTPVGNKPSVKEESNNRRQTRGSLKRDLVKTFERPKKRIRTEAWEPERRKKHPEVVWNAHYAALLEFKKEHGHCLIPKIHRENQPLSSWVFRQRAEYKKRQQNNSKSSYLTDERVAKLESNNFAWRTKCTKEQSALERKRRSGPEQKRWESFFDLLVAYKDIHGNCLVPKIYRENQTLSAWVFKQRAQMKMKNVGRDNRLTDDRVAKLNYVGFVWDAKSDKEWRELDQLKKQKQADVLWDQHYASLVIFKTESGHTRVPKRYKPNQALSAWVFRQRSHHRSLLNNKPNSLTERRQNKLQQIGFEYIAW